VLVVETCIVMDVLDVDVVVDGVDVLVDVLVVVLAGRVSFPSQPALSIDTSERHSARTSAA